MESSGEVERGGRLVSWSVGWLVGWSVCQLVGGWVGGLVAIKKMFVECLRKAFDKIHEL